MQNHKNELLKVEHLQFGYDRDKVLFWDLNLCINRGERIAVMGENGGGKSTFFLILNGVLAHQGGHIIFQGKEVGKKDYNALRRHVGIVFQEADNQIIASSVVSEISFGPMNLKLPREEVEQRVDRALQYMNLQEYKNRPPHYLSGGEKKRVSIADIVAMESEMILMDEPTSSLDPKNIAMLEAVLARMTEEGKTLLISTHDVDFAYRWAERILVFTKGQMIADGKPTEIFSDSKLLERAGLKAPIMYEVYDMLVKAGKAAEGKYPRTPQELQEIL